MKWLSFLLSLVCALSVLAQNGDRKGEVQPAPEIPVPIPEAPPLPVEQALRRFHLQEGFEIEVVASEPLIEAPVEIEFAPDGRIYVLEMRGFMRSLDGAGETEPLGRVSRLEDTDGDGKMDRSTVFVDGLVMPRAIAPVRDGLLVAEPPHLWFFQDEDGDGTAEKKEEISNDYGNQRNPEHTANGLLWGRDNWIYSANHTVRYRNTLGYWEKETTQFRGQWGITQDDYGRLFFNSNSDQLRGDLVPGHYLLRNPHFKSPFGVNVQVAKDQSTFPARVNPGVNRAYQKGTLRADGTLARFTGACGPWIYRGDLFPEQFYGAAFLCEPTANLVRCNLLTEQNGIITATNAFPNSEFLTSADERFRPVNLRTGPDGALYIVDMYRGVIQHRIYLTTYLREQALSRGLDAPLDMGRIYRVKPKGSILPAFPALASLSSEELVGQLAVTNGWVRDTAQQLLVERNDFQSFQPLNDVVAKGEFPAAIHALWALSSLGELAPEAASGALRSAHGKVRATAIRVAEPYLRVEEPNDLSRQVLAMTNDLNADVQLQLMFTLSEGTSPKARQALLTLFQQHLDRPLLRAAAISGAHGRELAFITAAAGSASTDGKARQEAVRALSESTAQSRDPGAMNALLHLAASGETWQSRAILDGINALAPRNRGARDVSKPLRLNSEPAALAKLKNRGGELGDRVAEVEHLLVWPGKPGYDEPKITPLTAEEQARFEAGRALYPVICGACHQLSGAGLEGLAPPLVDADWVTGSPERLVRIVLNGLRGKIEVKGQTWEMEMPPLNVLSDEDIANLLTYIRREWGHSASPVHPDFVGRIRSATSGRDSAWTEAELLKLK